MGIMLLWLKPKPSIEDPKSLDCSYLTSEKYSDYLVNIFVVFLVIFIPFLSINIVEYFCLSNFHITFLCSWWLKVMSLGYLLTSVVFLCILFCVELITMFPDFVTQYLFILHETSLHKYTPIISFTLDSFLLFIWAQSYTNKDNYSSGI